MEILYTDYWGNPVWKWLITIAIAIVAVFLIYLFRSWAVRRIKPRAKQTTTLFDDAAILIIEKSRLFFIIILSLYIGLLFVALPPHISKLTRSIIFIALGLQAGFWGNALIRFWIASRTKPGEEMDTATGSAFGIIAFFARLVLWSGIVLWLLDNLGVNITALVAGMGIGGIAIALAVQSILGDILSSVSIVLDKPFEVGDFITIGNYLGTVERIGIKTTRVRSLEGDQLVFSNTDLIKGPIRNYKRMNERRVLFTFTVTYQTPVDKLEAIPQMIREIIATVPQTRCDRVHFKSYGDSALIFEVVYFVTTQDYNTYMDIHQAINLAIYRKFEQEHIEFAYPTQTIYVNQENQPPR
jgi:small-conductance mechanosensitive channel